ncbi:histidine phosphatase family protein [Rhodoplanes sp. Z2-YC6860]|uniref:histidine phosphatase family protein n=1 Tax=Rhodoplanes sp. Z2-YC6860 TaxID=674703 RepID=UPI00078BEDE7|nr:histidine phosphatase family protein [Rhodoplanes sp. Z2-YC6860]AMN41070.1 Phosphoglycerate mutase [Rhodoplanes sp. Z2-YC6860]
MPRPILYFVRHGETDWNRDRRLQGQHDIPLNALGRTQAEHCGVLLRDLLARNGRAIADYNYVSSPLGRARETMELMRGGMGLEPGAYRTDARLMEMSFGRWEGFTYAELQSREAAALAEQQRDKWGFVLPSGESYAQLEKRVQVWYEGLERETVAAAHGGVCRVLMAYIGVAEPAAASMGNIGQGVVYVFDGKSMIRHE